MEGVFTRVKPRTKSRTWSQTKNSNVFSSRSSSLLGGDFPLLGQRHLHCPARSDAAHWETHRGKVSISSIALFSQQKEAVQFLLTFSLALETSYSVASYWTLSQMGFCNQTLLIFSCSPSSSLIHFWTWVFTVDQPGGCIPVAVSTSLC